MDELEEIADLLEKRRKISYANSEYWWSQRFPVDHELVELVLSFEDRWDIL